MFDRLVSPQLADAALAHLRVEGVQRGAIVAWLGHNSWDMLATLVACQRLGAVLLPLNGRLAAAELARIVRHAGAGHLMGTAELAALTDAVQAMAPPQPGPAAGVLPGDLLLVYTSGTTGPPKGAMHTAAGLQANALAAIAAQVLDADTRVLSVLPLFHVGGLCIQTLPALAVGARVLLHPRFEAAACWPRWTAASRASSTHTGYSWWSRCPAPRWASCSARHWPRRSPAWFERPQGWAAPSPPSGKHAGWPSPGDEQSAGTVRRPGSAPRGASSRVAKPHLLEIAARRPA